jgi:glutaminyl-tRNA synthetase
VPEGQDWKVNLNPKSEELLTGAKLEPSLKEVKANDKVQFERLGYFSVDKDSAEGRLVFNRAVSLKDTYARESKKGKKT